MSSKNSRSPRPRTADLYRWHHCGLHSRFARANHRSRRSSEQRQPHDAGEERDLRAVWSGERGIQGSGRTLARTYDLDYRSKTILDSASGGLSLGYGYNRVGELTELKDGLQSAFKKKHTYDMLGRLTATQDPNATSLETYTYDRLVIEKS